tara:strand:- start:126052 stop:126576 length:525 start_codon:yes stop_codon:yes gene_type:complete
LCMIPRKRCATTTARACNGHRFKADLATHMVATPSQAPGVAGSAARTHTATPFQRQPVRGHRPGNHGPATHCGRNCQHCLGGHRTGRHTPEPILLLSPGTEPGSGSERRVPPTDGHRSGTGCEYQGGIGSATGCIAQQHSGVPQRSIGHGLYQPGHAHPVGCAIADAGGGYPAG